MPLPGSSPVILDSPPQSSLVTDGRCSVVADQFCAGQESYGRDREYDRSNYLDRVSHILGRTSRYRWSRFTDFVTQDCPNYD
jgi:hypothetical protein